MSKSSSSAAAPPKHREISDTLREELAGGKFKPGSRLASESQLVARFSASRPTVARALRTLQEEGLVERRAGSGTFALEPSSGSRTNKRTLALLMPDLGHTEIFQQIAGEIASLARVRDYSIVWGGSEQAKLDQDVSLQHGEELCAQFIERQVDGVFFAPYELLEGARAVNRRIAGNLHDAGITVVLVDRDFAPFPQRSALDLVGIDNFAGGYAVGEHLVKLGCERICFVKPPRAASTARARVAGMRDAMEQHGLSFNRDWIFEGDPSSAVFLRKILAEGKPDALVGANDPIAALLLQGLAKAKINVPGDIRVVGFDDCGFATLVSPPLTTIHQPCREIALACFRTMEGRFENPLLPPRNISLPAQLVIRESCGAYL